MPRPFVYAPGLPGYGTRGVDGSAGLTGIATYFSAYDGNSDSVTIKSKIIANKELFSNDELIPGYPTRTYQTGDIFIDRNARIFQVDLDEANLYIDTGIFLNTSGFFSSGPVQTDSPNFERYSNQFGTQKYLIDSVYSNDVGNYATHPTTIYDIKPLYFGRIDLVDKDLSPDFINQGSSYYPFNIWSIDSADNNIAIALVKDISENLWRFGNYDDGSVRDVSLSLDFGDVYIGGTNGSGTIHGTFVGAITTDNLDLAGWLNVDGDTDLNALDVGGDVNLGSDATHSVKLRGDVVTVANSGSAGMNLKFASASAFGDQVMGMEPASPTTPRSLTIVGQDNTSVYTGGALTVRGGNSTSGHGGALNLYGGAGKTTSAGTGGKATLRGGSAYSAGDVDILGGAGTYAGDVNIDGGVGSTTPGNINISAGDRSGSGGIGGNVVITGGWGDMFDGNVNIGTSQTEEINIGASGKFISLNGDITASGDITATAGNITASSGDITATAGDITAGSQFRSDGTAAAPAYATNTDSNTGMYRYGTDILGFSLNGSPRWRMAYNGSQTQLLSNAPIEITCDNNAGSPGDIVEIRGGDSISANGGALHLYGGDVVSGAGTGGDVTIKGGSAVPATNRGKVIIQDNGAFMPTIIYGGTGDPFLETVNNTSEEATKIRQPAFTTIHHQKTFFTSSTALLQLTADHGSVIICGNTTQKLIRLPSSSGADINPGATVTIIRGAGGGVIIRPAQYDYIRVHSNTGNQSIDYDDTEGVSITGNGAVTFVFSTDAMRWYIASSSGSYGITTI